MKKRERNLSSDEVKTVLLDIAKELKRVCDILNIKFFLFYGTLLGAVRHKGFIPWDDDFDVGMFSDHYEILLNNFNDVANKRYRLIHYSNTDRYIWAYAKILDTHTVMYEKTLKPPFDYGLFVDVFPFYRIQLSDSQKAEFQRRMLGYYRQYMISHIQFAPGVWKVANLWNLFLYMTEGMKYGNGFKYLKMNPALIGQELKQYAESFENERGNYYFPGFPNFDEKFEVYGSSLFEDFVNAPFEDTEFLIPKEYDRLLTLDFGNYMQYPPLKDQEGRHIGNVSWRE